jgi:hypothetical protein
MAVRKRGGRWHYDLMIEQVRYRGAIQTARTKAQALQAEAKIRLQIHHGKYGRPAGPKTLNEFVENTHKPWAIANKKSWKIDMSRLKPILAFFGKKKDTTYLLSCQARARGIACISMWRQSDAP